MASPCGFERQATFDTFDTLLGVLVVINFTDHDHDHDHPHCNSEYSPPVLPVFHATVPHAVVSQSYPTVPLPTSVPSSNIVKSTAPT